MKISALLIVAALLAGMPGTATAAGPEPLAPAVAGIRDALRGSDIDRAIDAADAAVEALPQSAIAWWWAGRAYGQQAMQAGLFSKAKWAGRTRDAFEKAVELDPSHVRARADLMSYYQMAPGFMGGGRDKAEAQAAAIATLDPSMGKVAEAQLARADDEDARAEALLVEALALDPHNLSAASGLAAIAAARKDWKRVRELWRGQLDNPDSDRRLMATYQLGRTAAVSGEQLDEGLAVLDRFIATEQIPFELSVAAAYWRRGQVLEQLGRRDEAIESLQRAIDDRDVGKQAREDLQRLRKG